MLALDAVKEVGKSFRAVIDVKLFEHLTAGQADGDAVASTSDVHADVDLGRNNHVEPPYWIETIGNHPLVSSTYRATTKRVGTIPDDIHG